MENQIRFAMAFFCARWRGLVSVYRTANGRALVPCTPPPFSRRADVARSEGVAKTASHQSRRSPSGGLSLPKPDGRKPLYRLLRHHGARQGSCAAKGAALMAGGAVVAVSKWSCASVRRLSQGRRIRDMSDHAPGLFRCLFH